MSNRSNKSSKEKQKPVTPKQTRTQIKQRQLRILLLSILGLAALIIAGAVLYQNTLAPYTKIVINVDNSVLRMDYFLRRARMLGDDIDATVQRLEYEQIVKIEAKKNGITITDADVSEYILSSAASENVTASSLADKSFVDWYNEKLKSNDLTSAQYRDLVRINLAAEQIQTLILQNIPDTALQVHLHAIVLNSSATANAVKARLNDGEDFSSVAKEVSVDTQTAASGGDLGWIPEGILYAYDDVIFALDVGKASDVVTSANGSQYYIFMVSEKDAERSLDDGMKQQMVPYYFQSWLDQNLQEYKQGNKITDNLDAKTRAWVEWQLSKINY
jgi:foldase protein PrsA